jgi:hypothetical protein
MDSRPDNSKGKMVLIKPTSAIQDGLEIMGIPAIIPIYASHESALCKLFSVTFLKKQVFAFSYLHNGHADP